MTNKNIKNKNMKKQNNEIKRMQLIAGLITENEYRKSMGESIGTSFPSSQTWQLWLRLSEENEIEDYEINTWNHLQVNSFIKELQWIENNKDKYDDEEMSEKFSNYLDTL
jgi:hypothetical protein